MFCQFGLAERTPARKSSNAFDFLLAYSYFWMLEKPRAFAPRGQSNGDPRKLFCFDP